MFFSNILKIASLFPANNVEKICGFSQRAVAQSTTGKQSDSNRTSPSQTSWQTEQLEVKIQISQKALCKNFSVTKYLAL